MKPVYFLALFIVFSSCKKNDDKPNQAEDYAIIRTAKFSYKDSSGNSIIDRGTKYNPDSIKFFLLNKDGSKTEGKYMRVFEQRGYIDYNYIYEFVLENQQDIIKTFLLDDTILIQLSSSDTDTFRAVKTIPDSITLSYNNDVRTIHISQMETVFDVNKN